MRFAKTHWRPSKWYVITGAPCSGKTSVINKLEERGYRVVHEVARRYINSELIKGKTIAEIKCDERAFERHILLEKIRIETHLRKDDIIFFDRGVPDSIAYYQLCRLDPAEPFQKSREVRYQKIFLFERLAFSADPVRSEDENIAVRLSQLIKKSYQSLGYDIIHVPSLSIEERTEYILERL